MTRSQPGQMRLLIVSMFLESGKLFCYQVYLFMNKLYPKVLEMRLMVGEAEGVNVARLLGSEELAAGQNSHEEFRSKLYLVQ